MTEKITITQKQADEVAKFSAEFGYTPLNFHRAFHKQTMYGQNFNSEIVESIQKVTKMGEHNEFGILQKLYVGNYEVEPKYEAGDWVVIEKGDNAGVVTKIVNAKVFNGTALGLDFDNQNEVLGRDEIRHATPKEIRTEKNRQLWESTGREVGVFWDGDIALDKFGKVLHATEEMEAAYQMGDLSGFHPASSYISFKVGDSND